MQAQRLINHQRVSAWERRFDFVYFQALEDYDEAESIRKSEKWNMYQVTNLNELASVLKWKTMNSAKGASIPTVGRPLPEADNYDMILIRKICELRAQIDEIPLNLRKVSIGAQTQMQAHRLINGNEKVIAWEPQYDYIYYCMLEDLKPEDRVPDFKKWTHEQINKFKETALNLKNEIQQEYEQQYQRVIVPAEPSEVIASTSSQSNQERLNPVVQEPTRSTHELELMPATPPAHQSANMGGPPPWDFTFLIICIVCFGVNSIWKWKSKDKKTKTPIVRIYEKNPKGAGLNTTNTKVI
uniref:Uncharacterized protein n=1 Tax=Flabellia petiolata TaxID=189428 RepID=A0A386AX57_9CHLO|nr:hypothetical protein [Flabellia petiolata]